MGPCGAAGAHRILFNYAMDKMTLNKVGPGSGDVERGSAKADGARGNDGQINNYLDWYRTGLLSRPEMGD